MPPQHIDSSSQSHFLRGKVASADSSFCRRLQSAHCTQTVHTLYTHLTHTVHTLYTHCTHIVHTLHTHPTQTVHTLHTRCTHTVHTTYTHCIHTAHTLYTLYTHCTQCLEKIFNKLAKLLVHEGPNILQFVWWKLVNFAPIFRHVNNFLSFLSQKLNETIVCQNACRIDGGKVENFTSVFAFNQFSVNPNPDGWDVYDSRNFEQV
jgi:hypothetical protein